MVVDFNNSTMSLLHLIMLATLMKIDEGTPPEYEKKQDELLHLIYCP